ncbi:imidazoleglycerol-phosphate dehydratase HisB [Symbiobacterium thermophilum]|uniref:Imidazoleglycerol-phosphate dehydratase n=1 Tax=Symbiobacterium thermophilum (strain DSM 24528 / JCM 14929 / IAM 14863 / T) TaxID=292459 RepID=HIS7_SYMTH|nr:imidazoleglycerol-phosphate dehydratase HisB [Symbiobacterium thermophilum]Q67KH7.1 RecName: Full=Imidazoleglycerol-phosphate dehydratase; Short=IGPD [Symbiobacterium thermophilum IAM 14863]BAD41821.1 imidazoleglycerol-phosphate dehydratase [Symbiobacterium thermophilum IAM 14863]
MTDCSRNETGALAERVGQVARKTRETDIAVTWRLDGAGRADVDTGVPFFDHMLDQIARHSLTDLTARAVGDLEIDAHHTVEDTGIALGQALRRALGDGRSIRRYGSAFVPFDETLAFAAVDVSGRPYLVFDAALPAQKVGNFDTELAEEFFRALAMNAGITLHLKVHYGRNTHHMIEGLFKAFARALGDAVARDPRVLGVPSTKGALF